MHFDSMPPLPEMPKGVVIRHCPLWPMYAITNTGDPWSCKPPNLNTKTMKWHRLAKSDDLYGYHKLLLVKDGKKYNVTVHRLVLEAFVGPRPKGMQARHFPDRDGKNNNLSNLSWATPKANQADRIVHKTDMRGDRHRGAKLTAAIAAEIRAIYVKGSPTAGLYALARKYGVTSSTIFAVIKNKTWSTTPPTPGDFSVTNSK